MITVNSMKCIVGKDRWDFQFKGESTDTKPQESWLGNKVAVNSMFFELDTGDFYYLESPAQKVTETIADDIDVDNLHQVGEEELYVYTLPMSDPISADTIEVTIDGVSYICNKVQAEDGWWSYGATDSDFSDMPFGIVVTPNSLEINDIYRPNDGEFFLTIIAENVSEAVWKKFGSGGGEPEPTGEKLFDGSVTTTYEGGVGAYYDFNPVLDLNYSSLIVEFEGTRYTVSNISESEDWYEFGAPFDVNDRRYDFSEYPFNIGNGDDGGEYLSEICTESEGTYSLKIWTNSDPVTDDDVMPSPDDPH